jgi:hypothetical protein
LTIAIVGTGKERSLVQQGFELHAVSLLIEKLLQVFARREAVSCAGDHQNTQVFVISQPAQQLHHFVMELGVHGVFLVGPIQGDGDNVVFAIDENGFVIRHYGSPPFPTICAESN